MKWFGLIYLALCLSQDALSYDQKEKKIDDWDTNLTQTVERNLPFVSKTVSAPSVRTLSQKIGFSVGGAKDTNNFELNIKKGYLPQASSITYEGVFYDHYFDTALKGECKALFCPSYARAVTLHPLSGEKYYYLSVGLNSGLEKHTFKRKKLNLVVVIDVSGSMRSGFDRYFYDRSKSPIEQKSKMEIANASIASMIDRLKPNDRLGVVLFDHRSYAVKPLRLVGTTDMEAIKKHILALKPRGGTNWSAGYQEALKYFEGIEQNGYENRIVFITDAMPNLGELRKEGLLGMAKSAAEKGIHTTFIGVGIDFNVDLVNFISKIKGANYYSVHSEKAFAKRLDEEFDFMVTPLVFDLELKVASKGFKVDAIYGAPEADIQTGKILRIGTLFPSATQEDKTKGGVVLLRLKKIGKSDTLKLSVRYKDTQGKNHTSHQYVRFFNHVGYDNLSIRKAIVLSEYVTLMKNWLMDARAFCIDRVKYPVLPLAKLTKRCVLYPPKHPYYPQMQKWQRRSCPLRLSKPYKKIFTRFKRHLKQEIKTLQDTSLNKELKIVDTILKKTENLKDKADDWVHIR